MFKQEYAARQSFPFKLMLIFLLLKCNGFHSGVPGHHLILGETEITGFKLSKTDITLQH